MVELICGKPYRRRAGVSAPPSSPLPSRRPATTLPVRPLCGPRPRGRAEPKRALRLTYTAAAPPPPRLGRRRPSLRLPRRRGPSGARPGTRRRPLDSVVKEHRASGPGRAEPGAEALYLYIRMRGPARHGDEVPANKTRLPLDFTTSLVYAPVTGAHRERNRDPPRRLGSRLPASSGKYWQ
jgi:hypothetical protein